MDANPGVMISVKGGGSGTGIAGADQRHRGFRQRLSRNQGRREVAEAEANGVHRRRASGRHRRHRRHREPGQRRDGSLDRGPRQDLPRRDHQLEATSAAPTRTSSCCPVTPPRARTSTSRRPSSPPRTRMPSTPRRAQLLASNQAIVDEVTGNDGAIGYVGLGYLTDDVKVLEIDGVAASIETATDGSYPISRYLYMYSNGEPEGVMAAYLDWILGAEGQAIVADQGFVPLAVRHANDRDTSRIRGSGVGRPALSRAAEAVVRKLITVSGWLGDRHPRRDRRLPVPRRRPRARRGRPVADGDRRAAGTRPRNERCSSASCPPRSARCG